MLKTVLLASAFLAGSIVHVLPAIAFIGNGTEIVAPALSKSPQLILAKAEGGRDEGNKRSAKAIAGRDGDDDDDHHHNHHHHQHHNHNHHHHDGDGSN